MNLDAKSKPRGYRRIRLGELLPDGTNTLCKFSSEDTWSEDKIVQANYRRTLHFNHVIRLVRKT